MIDREMESIETMWADDAAKNVFDYISKRFREGGRSREVGFWMNISTAENYLRPLTLPWQLVVNWSNWPTAYYPGYAYERADRIDTEKAEPCQTAMVS